MNTLASTALRHSIHLATAGARAAALNPVRVFVVDDHAMFRRGMRALVEGDSAFAWAGEAASAAEALHCAPHCAPDVVVVDLVMPNGDGATLLHALRAVLPRSRFVALTCTLDAADARRALGAGALSVLLKTATALDIAATLQAAHRGRAVLSPEVSAALQAQPQAGALGTDLTERERCLLTLMAHGLANREIAARLAIAMPTVKFHITNILSKLHVENRTAAVLAALRHRLVQLG